MATIVLGAVGTAIGAGFGGTILGLSGAAIGGMIGSGIGSMVDSWIVSSLIPGQRIEGARMDSLRVTSATEGVVIPRVYGRMRIGGNIIWATDFREEVNSHRQGGGKGGGPKVTTTEYLYYASFAVALCEGPITGIGRIWADGKPLDSSAITMRWYPGDEAQAADPFIAAKMGSARTPAYRGTAYVMFEELPLSDFGNRLPQLSFEVFRPLDDADTAEGLVEAVTIIPASGEFAYDTEIVRKPEGGASAAENMNAMAETPDMLVSLDRLEAMVPSVKSASLVVSWFGDDLRAGQCTIRPKVEMAQKNTSPAWEVNGVTRAQALVVSQDDQGRPVYGGTPADLSVVQAIREMKARGLKVTFYPFLMMDIPKGNALPDPYSDNAAGIGQPVLPWRGRITCAPAAGFAGSVDKTASAAAQVAAFFGNAQPSDFAVSGETVTWTGGADWGFRRMILHYAHLCAAAGGVDAFLIGSEMRGLTQVRSGAATYPAVQQLQSLAAAVRAILGPGTKISYAADWSEYFGHHPADGSGDVFFHLDPLWADANVDCVGIDNYMPLSDWRDGWDHLDALAWPGVHDRAYLQSNIAGGEGFDWFYASDVDRAHQTRTPISDGAGKPWVFRYKDLHGWWSNPHFDRPGGVESTTPTPWQPQSKPIRFTELGCPAVDRGTNQPNVFHDPKSSESFFPYFSRGWRDDAIQRAYLEATWLYWHAPANNPVSSRYGAAMVDIGNSAAWTWDARPYPFFPELSDLWSDGGNWRLGHWLTGRLGAVSLAALVRHLCLRAGMRPDWIDSSGLTGAADGYVISALESPRTSITMLARHFGFDAVESEGMIRFLMRGRAPVATIAPDNMISAGSGEVMELTRGQETELPQSLKWQVARADEDYDAITVEARRITVDATRVSSDSFAVAVPPEEADRRCRRALMEAWIGRESASFRLPPSQLALDPGDVIALNHDGRLVDYRILTTADAEARSLTAIRQDRGAYDLPPGTPRPASLTQPVVFGAPDVAFLDLPQLSETQVAHHPLVAAQATPWPGTMAVYRSPEASGFELLTSFSTRARMGVLTADLYSGPVSRFDHGNSVYVDMRSGTLESVTDLRLFRGANSIAIAQPGGGWEILQFGNADLTGPGQYRLSRLLRGQRGTEGDMAPMVPAGARVVVLDAMLAPLAVTEAELGLPWNWRIGPASRPVNDASFAALTFTPRGIGLRPFAPVHVEQPWRHAREPGDLTIRWKRRDRAIAADSWNTTEVPISEAGEVWQVEILNGAAVKRVLTAASTSALYTAAQQIADWGAPLRPGDSLRIRIAQIGQAFGPGAATTTTLWF
ncbi:glycoside hydrolase TIM-barrel-like domain-containing protein [Paracoccus sp. (in: a-proteobacteria)]|uniref:baseplate multidomain protein megatron n=1 Tax=Paracoccus sp. TaxID=267 RepID=UPI00321F9FF2